jgi:outer membrane protein
MIKKNIVISIFTLIFKVAVAQQQTNAFTLQQAIDYSIKNSPNYLNAELDQKNAVYRKNEITGLGLPQIEGSIDIKDYIDIPTSLLPGTFFGFPADVYIPVKFGTKYNTTAGFSASQLIFSSDYIFGLKAAKEFLNLSKINTLRTKSELVASVSKAYYNVIINKERNKLLQANVDRIKKIYDETKAFNQQGFVELIDVERLEVQYNNLKTEKEKTDRLIELSEAMLKFQMGYKINDPISLSDSLSSNTNDASELNVSKIDVTKRPDYQLLESQQKLNIIDVKRLKMGYLPTLAAYGSYQFNTQRSNFEFDINKNNALKQWYKISLIGATLNLSIFDGLQRYNKIQQAKITSQKAENTIKNLELGAQLEANAASISYINAQATLTTQKQNMALAEHVYDVTQKKYTQGVGTNLDIVTAETSLKEAQTNYLSAVYDMLVAKIDYQKAIGTLVK